jgi:transcriptional regulator with XRE-family HTH domain
VATPLETLQAWRVARGMTLDALADAILARGHPRPSKAKLSRAEKGKHALDIELVPHIRAITGLPASELCPDIVRVLADDGSARRRRKPRGQVRVPSALLTPSSRKPPARMRDKHRPRPAM